MANFDLNAAFQQSFEEKKDSSQSKGRQPKAETSQPGLLSSKNQDRFEKMLHLAQGEARFAAPHKVLLQITVPADFFEMDERHDGVSAIGASHVDRDESKEYDLKLMNEFRAKLLGNRDVAEGRIDTGYRLDAGIGEDQQVGSAPLHIDGQCAEVTFEGLLLNMAQEGYVEKGKRIRTKDVRGTLYRVIEMQFNLDSEVPVERCGMSEQAWEHALQLASGQMFGSGFRLHPWCNMIPPRHELREVIGDDQACKSYAEEAMNFPAAFKRKCQIVRCYNLRAVRKSVGNPERDLTKCVDVEDVELEAVQLPRVPVLKNAEHKLRKHAVAIQEMQGFLPQLACQKCETGYVEIGRECPDCDAQWGDQDQDEYRKQLWQMRQDLQKSKNDSQ